jgi:hypothetical protein
MSLLARFDVRDADTFKPLPAGAPARCAEYVMAVAGHILKMDCEPLVRAAAAQALRDVAASDPPRYQFLAASFADMGNAQQSDPRVQAVIQGIFDDSKIVNFQRHQKIPGLT